MVNLLFSGDFAPLNSIENISDKHFSGLSEMLAAADIHITNLEAPLTIVQKPILKTGPSLKADPAAIDLLKQAKVDIACLSNNHIFDFGEEGIIKTIETCESKNIETIGIVSRLDGRSHWLIKEIKGIRIGFINYCEHEFSVRGKGLLGACGFDPVTAYYDIGLLKTQVDFLVVIYHGGNEYYPLPRPDLKRDFHFLADLGADAVIGHHTHVFSGYEIYKNKPLVYSLGNFYFPLKGEPDSWHTGLLCQLTITSDVKIKLKPVLQCKVDLNVVFLDKKEEDILLEEIKNLSMLIENEKKLQKEWNNHVIKTGESLSRLLLFPTKIDKLLSKLPLTKKYLKDSINRNAILNILRCRSLEQLMTDHLKRK